MKTTLVAVSGMSPAIITETLWALACESPPVVPDDVVVITTSKGETDIRSLLLKSDAAWSDRRVWDTLREDILRKTGTAGTRGKLQLSIRVIDLPDESGGVRQPAEDLRSREHNEEAANFILRTLAAYCDAHDNHVIASIAGGRKTMGALLYAAMSLVGKETDRVTHVLVSEPFETVRGFFYNDQPVQTLEARPFGKPDFAVTAADAKVEMADIPFVPLRNGFAEMNESRLTFGGLVGRYCRELQRPLNRRPVVSLDVNAAVLTVEGISFGLTGRELLVAAFLFLRAKEGKKPFSSQKAAADSFLDFVAKWKLDFPNHRALERMSKDQPAVATDLTKGLYTLRNKLAAKGLLGAIPYLAPERSRVGFEMDFG